MRGNELLDKMELIDPAYIEAADTAPNKRKSVWAKWGTLAACLCLVCVLAVPAMAAFSPAFYELLYAVTPATAQFFKPVQRSCEDNGIRMEVTAAYIHENTAEIYLSLEDLTGTSFDETVDLFDSYRLHTPFDCTGHCQLASYDPDTHTATFLVTLEQWDRQSIEGEKLTFSVQKLLSGKKTWEGTLDGVDLGGSLTSATQTVQPRGLSGDLLGSDGGKSVTVLKPGDAIASPVDGVTLTGIGYVDGRLHVQVYYADIPKTDNHGSISLVNRETGEQIECDGSAAFFDDAGTGSYEDYVFTGIEADALDTYALYGMFVTSAGPVEGNWSVTFPLENTAGNCGTGAYPNRFLHSSVSLSYSGKNPTLKSVGFFAGESPYFPETVEGATGADRFCLVTLTKGEATPSPLTGTQFPVLAVSPGLGCLTGRIKAFLL